MITKELLKIEIDQLDTKYLELLHQMIQPLKSQITPSQSLGLLEKLSTIKIVAPPDFSENFEAYLNGEKDF
jgi:hypothetical protein